ncbi:MAG TPA: lysophospholipid acyltransferase family protein [Flavobacteriales bacterium]|nr:lysophospholipid acyltransferase family protein [Flavobacteriales bacterium]
MAAAEATITERTRVVPGEDRRSVVLKWLFLPLRWIYKLYFALVFFGSLVVLYIPFRILLFHPRRYQRAFRLKRAWAFFLQCALGIPLRTERRGTLPAAPYIICCNHSSYLDIIQMYNVVPTYFLFMGKYELLRWPLFNIFFKGMNIAVNRGDRVEAAKAFRKAADTLDRGVSLALFPEGTIPGYTPRMKPFKDGAFRLAIEKQVPIVPVTFLDHWRLFGEPAELLSRARPGLAHAVVHGAIPTAGLTMDDLVTLRDRVYRTIEEPLLRP